MFLADKDNIIKDFISQAESGMYKKKEKKQHIIIACDDCSYYPKNISKKA
ncbi:MAG: hypothetical protein ACYCTB_09870 [bacterium]